MSTIEFAEELNQQRRRFSNTGAMTAKAAEPALVRSHSCASELGLLGVLGTYQQTLSGVSARATVAQPLIFFNLPLGYYLFPPHDPTKHFSMEARHRSSLA